MSCSLEIYIGTIIIYFIQYYAPENGFYNVTYGVDLPMYTGNFFVSLQKIHLVHENSFICQIYIL